MLLNTIKYMKQYYLHINNLLFKDKNNKIQLDNLYTLFEIHNMLHMHNDELIEMIVILCTV